MNFSAASSSSPVVTPSRTLDSSSLSVRTRISPAAAILSISAGVFLMITPWLPRLDLVFEPQRRDRRPDVVVHLGGRERSVEAVQQPAVVVERDQRLGLLVVDVEPLADRFRLVVGALDERCAVAVADVGLLRRVEVDVIDVLRVLRADAAAGDPAHDVLVGSL